MATPEEKESENLSHKEQNAHKGNWITDMYDKMNIPVKALDAMLIILGALIVFLFMFGNQIQLGF